MARTPGSKNRSTYIKELRAAGNRDPNLDNLSTQELKALAEKKEVVVIKAPVKVPVVVQVKVNHPVPHIPHDTAKAVYNDCIKVLEDMQAYYGDTDIIPDRIVATLMGVYQATSIDDAKRIAKRTKEKTLSYLLAQWADGRVPGPNTPDNIEQRARKAEGLARLLEKQGHSESAQKQTAKAALIRSTPAVRVTSSWF